MTIVGDFQREIRGAAKATGWRTAHFRPGRVTVDADGDGFPDLLLIHPAAGFVWFVAVLHDDRHVPGRQLDARDGWRHDLIAAGAVHRLVLVPSGLDDFIDELRAATETRIAARSELAAAEAAS